jgi:methylthioribose-1-phosphate isomerase
MAQLDTASAYLALSRPTAVNLTWALNRLRAVVQLSKADDVTRLKECLLAEAMRIRDEDEDMCRAIGRVGESLIQQGTSVLTHCNAGSLATSRYGTALAPLYVAHERGRQFRAYVDETRPLLQGARLTAWELQHAGIETTLLCDSAAGTLLAAGRVDLVITGADRIAANGDVANKVGTYSLAVLAAAAGVPFYVAAPSSTFDLSLEGGSRIPIEMRDADEVRCGFGKRTAPADIPCYTPAFDVTPARLIRAILTERGAIEPVNRERTAAVLGQALARTTG